jgi:galactokinase
MFSRKNNTDSMPLTTLYRIANRPFNSQATTEKAYREINARIKRMRAAGETLSDETITELGNRLNDESIDALRAITSPADSTALTVAPGGDTIEKLLATPDWELKLRCVNRWSDRPTWEPEAR